MAEQYQVKVKVGDTEIEVSGAEAGVVSIVEALANVLAGRSGPQTSVAAELDRPSAARAPTPRSIDARSFFQEKAPSSQAEAVAVAAYYLSELAPSDMRSETVDAMKVTEVFRQAKYPLPKRTPQSLVNTQNAGYLKRSGPGEYKLTPVGFNLVEHTLGPDGKR